MHSHLRRGFALVVTLSLMILLTVIAVGLLSLSSIALRSNSLSSARKTAEGNARMAMMIAIGQLQLHAGTDQLISATADIASGPNGVAAVDSIAPTNQNSLDGNPTGISIVQPGTRHWTGIWKNRDSPTQIYTQTPEPELIQWLVSGNEAIPKKITPASVEGALKADGTINDPKKQVILAGGNSAGNKTTNPSYYVSAPLVNIAGTGSLSSKTVGRYAWWVADEGVKAKFNLTAPYSSNSVAKYENFSTQRSGWEVVTDFADYPLPGTPGSTSLAGVVTMPQASLLPEAIANALSFHSATTDSFGVIADVLQGGLRHDLTSGLRQSLPITPPAPAIPNAITSDKNIIPQSIVTTSANMKGPKWDRLKDFNDLAKTLENGSLKVKPAATASDHAIAPTIMDLRLLLGAKLVPSSPSVPHQFNVYPCAKVAVTLANPYSVPLKWDGLDLEIKNSYPGPTRVSCIWNVSGQPAFIPKDTNDPAVFNKAIFRIPSGTLQPGAAIAYSMTGETLRPSGSVASVVVPMGEVSAGSLLDFKNSLILMTTTAVSVAGNSVISMDVREASVTSMIDVELRPQSSEAILRKLERFELDNSEFIKTTRRFGSIERPASGNRGPVKLAQDFTLPVPLQLYSFQISQPGADYRSLLPNATDLGIRSSTLRTYADFNLQATRFRKTNTSYNPAPYFMTTANQIGYLPFTAPGGDTGSKFTDGLAVSPIRWGRDAFQTEKTILFSPPSANEMIVSLAQFQHADLTGDDIYASVAHQPGNAIGNSYASPFLLRQNVSQSRPDYRIISVRSGNGITASTQTNYYDISYLLNTALWDSYFCSTIPDTGAPVTMNQKLVKIDSSEDSPALRDPAKAASRLLINGAFNINSTSKDAWKAFLAGTKHLKHPADTASSPDALFARSLGQTSPGKAIPSGTSDDSFAGFRRMNDSQIDALADEITKQVRLRGPFVSLSHFVNRSLVALTTNKDLGRSGALQSALDNSGINISPNGIKSAFTEIDMSEEKLNLQAEGDSPRADMPGDDNTSFPVSDWPKTTNDGNPGAVAGILAEKSMLTDTQYRPEQGFRSTGIPGWLTQADLLQVIGPSISARSDTFKIRSYGEALDSAGKVIAKAWCEAIVQRSPDYVSPDNAATDRDTSLTPVNKLFGRKFNIVSFRWLSPNEI
jgi:hypothetical protein